MSASLSGLCFARSPLLCGLCRNEGARGARWRMSVASQMQTPGGTDKWECPHGLPWGWQDGATPIVEPESRYGPCEDCPHAATHGEDALVCRLADSRTTCMLHAMIRAGGPWPAGCPRRETAGQPS